MGFNSGFKGLKVDTVIRIVWMEGHTQDIYHRAAAY